MSPPEMAPPSIAGDPARPTVEVRLDGALMRRVAIGSAEQLISRGWAQWAGSGSRRYVALTAAAPVSALPGWKGRDGTKPVTADQTCRRYEPGQLMGDPRRYREFR